LRKREHFEDLGIFLEDNIKIDLQKMGWWGMDWIYLA
jgi:hypothetical protein